jgi:bifunctional N-acetylglucosamine-1-phosphate-uridyltransferase/glucosamine-1-phosphate-acetyltransferase GlmU-like protein
VVSLLDRSRLPGKQSVAMVGANAVIASGEVVEDDVPDGAVWIGGRVAGQF